MRMQDQRNLKKILRDKWFLNYHSPLLKMVLEKIEHSNISSFWGHFTSHFQSFNKSLINQAQGREDNIDH